jgi:hypothetical protein
MKLNPRTIEKLVSLINEGTEYRSGSVLVSFFNELGFDDSYERGFPSRSIYTADKLNQINDTPLMEKCLFDLLSPINFIENIKELDNHILSLNRYLAFDNFGIVRNEKNIEIKNYAVENLQPNENIIINNNLKTKDQEVLDNYQKMRKRLKDNDLKGAITSSRTLLECVFDDIHNNFLGVYADRDAGNLSDQFKKIKNLLRFSPDTQSNDSIKSILQSFSSIIKEFDQLTCANSDRHKLNIPELPVNYHIANFCVNVSNSICTFLYELIDFKYGENVKIYDKLIKFLEEKQNRTYDVEKLRQQKEIKALLEITDNMSGKILIDKLIKEYEIPKFSGYYKSDVFFKVLELLEDYIIKEHITSIFKKYKNNDQACGLLSFLINIQFRNNDLLNKEVKDYLKNK